MSTSVSADPSAPAPHREKLGDGTTGGHVPLDPAAAERSARNIALWRSYLPTACVQAMIRMGWDRTT